MKKAVNMKIKWLGHSSFKITEKVVIYLDPYKIKEKEKADIILISHRHHDHYSPEDIGLISKEDTVIVATEDISKELSAIRMKAGDKFHLRGINIEAVPAYNIDKFRSENNPFHPKDFGIGYIIETENSKVYFAGDTDFIPEMKKIRADIALLPVGGTYTMTVDEAVGAARKIKPRIAIPMHFGTLIGSKADAEDFKIKTEKAGIKVVVLDKGDELEI